ncbi:PAAR domain-containing protein [Marimonas sp. MJW-29]|uniref:PAAR domain-containing protein n=1 Tax=Sulfitobacter sediminis TaxID=3234186 RepID=A0ABV3RRV1_9RHOB
MSYPAARITDMHLCNAPVPPPAASPPAPTPLVFVGAATVLIGNLPAARVGDNAALGVPHPIAKGSATVLTMSMPQARVMDNLACGGLITPPCCPTVLVGG